MVEQDVRIASGRRSTRSRLRSSNYAAVADYLLRRLGLYILTVWGAITISFFLLRLMPGDPMNIFLAQVERMSLSATALEEQRRIAEYYRHMFGLDRPLPVQYLLYVRNMTVGGLDMGPSIIAFPEGVRDVILRQLPWTLGLFTSSMLIAWVLGLSAGALAGWLRRYKISTVLVVVATLVMVTPVYLIAIALILLVAYHLRWLPPGQPYAAHLKPAWNWEFISSVLTHAVLPMSSMVLVWAASFTMSMRSLMISVLGEDYLAFAKAKGLAPRTILGHYAFRNAFLPMVTALGISLGTTLNGALVVEALFMLPGLGGLFGRAMALRDFNVMQGIVLISSITVLTLGLIVDLALPFFDPRVRRSDA